MFDTNIVDFRFRYFIDKCTHVKLRGHKVEKKKQGSHVQHETPTSGEPVKYNRIK